MSATARAKRAIRAHCWNGSNREQIVRLMADLIHRCDSLGLSADPLIDEAWQLYYSHDEGYQDWEVRLYKPILRSYDGSIERNPA